MPVTKSAKKALRTSLRRKAENVLQRDTYKKAIKAVKKAVESGSDTLPKLLSEVQSALDKAAKKNTIHPNKASRLKSRLAKKAIGTSRIANKAKSANAKAKAKAAPKKRAAAKK